MNRSTVEVRGGGIRRFRPGEYQQNSPSRGQGYMVGKLAPIRTPFTRGLVQYVLGRVYFRAIPSQKRGIFSNLSPPHSLNDSYASDSVIKLHLGQLFYREYAFVVKDEGHATIGSRPELPVPRNVSVFR